MLSVILMASCSKGVRTDSELVPITLGAGMEAMSKVGPTDAITAGLAGWEGATADYTNNPIWNTTIGVPASGGSVTWPATHPNYNSNAGTKTFMTAWYPSNGTDGTLSGKTVSFATQDGSIDLLLATAEGYKNVSPAPALSLAHKTTKMSFNVVAGTGFPAGNITKITVNGVKVPMSMELSATNTITWSAAKNLDVYSGAGHAITNTETTVPGEVMFEPWTTANVFPTISIETTIANYPNVSIATTSDTFLSEGKHYVITLTFNMQGISMTASIADWNAAAGTGSVL